jgi:hypothetical protein
LLDRRQDCIHIRMLASLLLGMKHLIPIEDFMHSTTGWDQRYLADLVNFLVKQFFRQTGGFLEIASRSAILDRHWPSVVGHMNLLRIHYSALTEQ